MDGGGGCRVEGGSGGEKNSFSFDDKIDRKEGGKIVRWMIHFVGAKKFSIIKSPKIWGK